MELISIDCPKCGASLKVEKGLDLITCEYCASTFELRATPPQSPASAQGGTKMELNDEESVEQAKKITAFLLKKFLEESGIDAAEDDVALGRIEEAARKAVQELKFVEKVDVNIPYLGANDSGPKHLQATIHEGDF